jgi:hypothetical protein
MVEREQDRDDDDHIFNRTNTSRSSNSYMEDESPKKPNKLGRVSDSDANSDEDDDDDDLPLSRARAHRLEPGAVARVSALLASGSDEELDQEFARFEKGYARARCGRNGRLLFDLISAEQVRTFQKRQKRLEPYRYTQREKEEEGVDGVAAVTSDFVRGGVLAPKDAFIREVDEELFRGDMQDSSLPVYIHKS